MAITDYKNKDTEKKDIKKASTEDIINLITTEYYTKKIEELETQLFNVRCGNPIYENGPIYTGEEKKKNEIRLESEIRKYEQILKEFKAFKSDIDLLVYEINEVAKEEALKTAFNVAIYHTIGREFSNPNEYTETYKIYKKETAKLMNKIGLKYSRIVRKKAKKAYRKLKKMSKLKVNVTDVNLSVHGDYVSIETLIEAADYKMSSLFMNYFYQQANKYEKGIVCYLHNNSPKFESSIPLEVQIDLLKKASTDVFDKVKVGDNGKTKLDNQNNFIREQTVDNSTSEGHESERRLEQLERIKRQYFKLNIKYSDIQKLIDYYTEVMDLSREVAGLEIVLDAFANTSFAKSQTYQKTIGIKNMQQAKMWEIYNNAENLYKNVISTSDLVVKSNLDRLYNEVRRINRMMESLSDQGKYDKLPKLLEDRKKIIEEMKTKLRENPNINPMAYNIELETDKENNNLPIQQIKYDKEQEHSIPITTEPAIQKSAELATYKGNIEKLINNYNNFASIRTQYYQDYVISGIRNSGCSITFLDYLKSKNNGGNLDKLIEYEQMKNDILSIIYKEYIMKYAEEYWYNVNTFKHYCANMSSLIKALGGVNSVINESDIEMFIENKIQENYDSIDFNTKAK